jgi:hypothetical protein
LPRQPQIWAVLRKTDTPQRLAYSLAATFFGRMCLSGEVHDFSHAQWKLTVSAMELYSCVYPIIRDGHPFSMARPEKAGGNPERQIPATRPQRRIPRLRCQPSASLIRCHISGNFPAQEQLYQCI